MFERNLECCVMLLLGLCCAGCDGAAPSSAKYDFPTALPIWIVEDDPQETIFDREDLERDRGTPKMLVIPLYIGYQHEGATDFLAIAHPFVYQQGDEIEKQLASLGQREKLRRLIFWVPGYFPDGMGRTFRWVPVIDGKRMAVVELQRCLGSEATRINTAMKTLLEGDFVVGEKILPTPPSPPYTNEPKMTEVPYDASRVVRSEYSGRFYNRECPENTHVLWAFPPGTSIVNRLSPDEKKMVAAFAEQATNSAAGRSSSEGGQAGTGN